MKYETPELTAVNAADSIQQVVQNKTTLNPLADRVHPFQQNEISTGAYADWE